MYDGSSSMMDQAKELVSHLNAEQQNAATSSAKDLLIIAGAGTGKTQTLIHRIAWLVASGKARPSNILATTFTNKAAKELQDRIRQIIGDEAQTLWCNTMHSICVKVLNMFHKQAGFSDSFTILDTRRKISTLSNIIATLRERRIISFNQEIDEKSLANKIGLEKESGRRSVNSDLTGTELTIYSAYEKECIALNLVDFDELILRTCELILHNQDVREYLHNKFTYVLLDEYQDTGFMQAKLIDLLTGNESCLTAVGDPDQSIYGWRGKGLGTVARLDETKENIRVTTVTLQKNYRSTNTILKVANQLIKQNQRPNPNKELYSDFDDDIPVKYWDAENQEDEAIQVVNEIQMLRSEGNALAQCAVLYRTGAQSRMFEKIFKEREIPYKISGGLGFFARAEILDIHAYLRLIGNRNDFFALSRAIAVPRRGIGTKTIESLRQNENGLSIWEGLLDLCNGSTKRAKSIKSFCAQIDFFQKVLMDSENLGQVIDALVNAINLLEFYKQKDNDEAYLARQANIDELKEYASRYVVSKADNAADILRDYLNSVALNNEDTADEDIDCLNLMTMHASKGLEFNLVFVVGVEDQLIPHINRNNDTNDIDEERRLLYVAITRAKKNLILSRAKERFGYNNTHYTVPSRFLYEIAEHLQGFRSQYAGQSNRQSDQRNIKQAAQKVVNNSLAHRLVNSEVVHKKFGSGIVESVQGTDNLTLKIRFRSNQVKYILYRPEFLRIVG